MIPFLMLSSVIYGTSFNSFILAFAYEVYSCMEHSVDLSAKTFVQAISPSSPRQILKKIKIVLKTADEDGSGTLDIDDLDGRLADFDFDEESEDDGEDGEGDKVAAADSVGKALALVKQVCFGWIQRLFIFILNQLQIRASPQARAFFTKSCQQVEVPILQLLLWIRTRWASLFAFLDRLLILKKVCLLFVNVSIYKSDSM